MFSFYLIYFTVRKSLTVTCKRKDPHLMSNIMDKQGYHSEHRKYLFLYTII
uniref:Uncharacterized protein n=1 Tax=Anguilla anguilla TaxID=7936 RepID=A0A0E9UHS4_ANGAN